MKVRCKWTAGSGLLTVGKIYDVTEVRGSLYRFVDDTGNLGTFYNDKFEIVEETNGEDKMDLKLTKYQQELYGGWVRSEQYTKLGEKTTVCLLILKNGFEVTGSSACVNPADFNRDIGKHYSLVSALDKLDELAGFARSL